jgi:hypothetical protein
MVALLLFAAPALAHPGHAHETAMVAVALPASIASGPEIAAADREAIAAPEAGRTSEGRSNETLFTILAKPRGGPPVPKGTCNGACCAAATCCMTGLPLEPLDNVAPRPSASRFLEAASPALAGIEPGRLPEPPRSFA